MVGCRRWLIAQAPFKLGVSLSLFPFCLRARLGKWLSTSSTLEPSAWPGGLCRGTYQGRPCSPRVAPRGRLGLVFDPSSAPPQRGLPGPRGAAVRALLRPGLPQGTGDPSSPEITLLAPKVPFPPGAEARVTCAWDPDAQGIRATWSFKLLLQRKEKKQTRLLEEPTRDGGAEPWTASELGRTRGPRLPRGSGDSDMVYSGSG